MTVLGLCLTSCGTDEGAGTCNDGVRNQDEMDVDCGGVCLACATCEDGIKNGEETEIDCGGLCNDCPTCKDGIKNGSETAIDCGGDCEACITCDDGIKNGDEIDIDCGGSCEPCPPTIREHISCRINNVAFKAESVMASNDGETIKFQTDSEQDEQMFFELPIDIGKGKHDLTHDGEFKCVYAHVLVGEYEIGLGEITITENDRERHELTGTFYFSAIWFDDDGQPQSWRAIQSGSFGVVYR